MHPVDVNSEFLIHCGPSQTLRRINVPLSYLIIGTILGAENRESKFILRIPFDGPLRTFFISFLLKMKGLLEVALTHESYLKLNLFKPFEVKTHLLRRDQGPRGWSF